MSMTDDEFVKRIQEKIERLVGREIELRIDGEEVNRLEVNLEPAAPIVTLGANVYQYAGFARMGIEYAVACIRRQRAVDPLEFHLLLARN